MASAGKLLGAAGYTQAGSSGAMMRGKIWLLALVMPLLAACATPSSYQAAQLEGTVAYKIRLALPPAKTRAEIRLLDISREGAPSVILAEQILEQPKGFPLPFSLRYDKPALRADGRYALEARIYLDGQLLMSSKQQVEALPQNGQAPIIWVDPVGN
ncbi:hypothetical protein EGI20_07900 [Aquitalea sp. S1-19]|nr:hypothetical protein [Aquitalea sp. S1-19]